jgi:hypothetical protein
VSMAVFSWVMGALAQRYALGSAKIYRAFMGACAATALVVGCFWLSH